jgi:hypothetical protein
MDALSRYVFEVVLVVIYTHLGRTAGPQITGQLDTNQATETWTASELTSQGAAGSRHKYFKIKFEQSPNRSEQGAHHLSSAYLQFPGKFSTSSFHN